jgi:choline monooxygenase
MDLSDYRPTKDLSRAWTIPSRWYTDASFLELEKKAVFWSTWQLACHTRDVAGPGQHVPVEVAGEPLVVARGEDDVLRAFSNVCRHRGALIVQESGRSQVLRCPYHGWTYKMDGRLHGAPEFEGVACWDPSQVRLPQSNVAAWGPFVLVNVDGAAESLEELMRPIASQIEGLGCPVSQLHFSERRDYIIHCNWKVYVDNYLEGYHLPAAHPSLYRELDYANYRVETCGFYSIQHAPIRPPRGEQPRRYGSDQTGGEALYFWIFPNLMLNVYPDNLSSNLIVPLSHDRTLTTFEWFTYPGESGPAPVKPETVAFSDEIQQEDIRICESVQRGLSSRTYQAGRLSAKRENGVHHFHLLLEEALTRGFYEKKD